MNSKPKKRIIEDVDTGEDTVIASLISNENNLTPLIRHAFESGHVQPLLQQLKHLAINKEIEIEDLCRLHYEEFIIAVDELRGVVGGAEQLKTQLQTNNFKLQEVGGGLLTKLDELLESFLVEKNVNEAINMCKVCFGVLGLCSKANALILEGKFYQCLKTIELIEVKYLKNKNIPVDGLRLLVESRIPMMKTHIEKRVCDEVNEWFVRIRSFSNNIGQTALNHSAETWKKDRDMLLSYRHLDVQESMYILDTDVVEEELCLEIDLTPIYRAFHTHKSLGIGEKFREFYYINRLGQLNSDLQMLSEQSFIDNHRTFLEQIAGFFIVEDRVLRTGDGLLDDSQVETMWETGVSKICSLFIQQFSEIDNPSDVLILKDYLTLFGVTLRPFGYEVSSLFEAISSTKGKYMELLMKQCGEQISEIVDSDTYEPMVIKKEYEYRDIVLSFDLQTSNIIPAFPYVAPFSSTVPAICQAVKSFIVDSVNFLSAAGNLDLFETVLRYTDALLTDIVNEAVLGKIGGASIGVPKAMQLAANASFLENACGFFVKTAARSCGPHIDGPRTTLRAKTVLKSSREASYVALIGSVNTQLDEYMSLTQTINWTPDEVQSNGHEYISEVTIFLESLLSTASRALPPDAARKVGSASFGHISDAIVAGFLSDHVKRFNANAVMTFDIDLRNLEKLAEERSEGTNGSYVGYLLEARQLVDLLLSSQPENFMNPVIRQKNYNALDPKKIAAIIEKFKDVNQDSLFGSLTNRNAKTSLQKKSMDVLRRRLRDFV